MSKEITLTLYDLIGFIDIILISIMLIYSISLMIYHEIELYKYKKRIRKQYETKNN